MSASRGFLDEPLRKLADQAPVLLWVARLDRCCEYVNPCWLTFTGRSFEQEIGDGWVGRVHPSDLDRCLATYHWAFEAREEFRVDFRLQRADETYRRVTELGMARVDAQGIFRGYLALCLETDEHKGAEHLLQRSQVLHSAILEAVPGNVNREVTRRHWAEALARGLARADSAQAHAALEHLIRCTKPVGEPSG